MNLKQYLEKNKINADEFAVKHGFGIASVYRYLRGKRPNFKVARKIEEVTEGKVTIEELRGKE